MRIQLAANSKTGLCRCRNMVHKKSEYTFQFHLLTNDIRKQIWQENIHFRESKRALNQANHFWTYQLSEDQCEDEVEEDLAALPPHRVKHKMLLAQYGSQYPVPDVANTPLASISRKQATEIPGSIVQRPQDKLQEHEPHLTSENIIRDGTNICDPQSNYQAQANSAILQQPVVKTPTLENSSLKDRNHATLSLPESRKRSKKLTGNNMPIIDLPIFSGTKPKPLSSTEITSLKRRPATSHSNTSKVPYSSRSLVTRTSRKAYYEEKKSPFMMFGWNDAQKTIGNKKTYNVHAPEKEVYEVALRALQRRRQEIEKSLASESGGRKQKTLDSTDECAKIEVDHGRVWMSEYQDQFSKVRDRPLEPPTRRSARKPASWRYS